MKPGRFCVWVSDKELQCRDYCTVSAGVDGIVVDGESIKAEAKNVRIASLPKLEDVASEG